MGINFTNFLNSKTKNKRMMEFQDLDHLDGLSISSISANLYKNNRDDLVVVLAGYKDKMDKFFESNPGFRSRIAHHIEFPDYSNSELLEIAEVMVASMNYEFNQESKKAMAEYIKIRKKQPHFANARSIRNAIDRARLRQANRVFNNSEGPIGASFLSQIEDVDIRQSRVFSGGIDK